MNMYHQLLESTTAVPHGRYYTIRYCLLQGPRARAEPGFFFVLPLQFPPLCIPQLPLQPTNGNLPEVRCYMCSCAAVACAYTEGGGGAKAASERHMAFGVAKGDQLTTTVCVS